MFQLWYFKHNFQRDNLNLGRWRKEPRRPKIRPRRERNRKARNNDQFSSFSGLNIHVYVRFLEVVSEWVDTMNLFCPRHGGGGSTSGTKTQNWMHTFLVSGHDFFLACHLIFWQNCQLSFQVRHNLLESRLYFHIKHRFSSLLKKTIKKPSLSLWCQISSSVFFHFFNDLPFFSSVAFKF